MKDRKIALVILIAVLILVGYGYIRDIENESIDSITQEEEIEEETEQITPFGESIVTSLYLQERYGKEHINVTLHNNVYEYYVNRDMHDCYIDESLYDCFVMPLEDPNDEYIIKEIVSKVSEKTGREGDNLVRRLLYTVTKIPYDEEALINDDPYIKTPYEVLYTNSGVCSEKSMLLAKMLKEMGYGIAFFVYEDMNHMAMGIKCNKGNYETDYCFLDPTGPGPSVIGHPPANFGIIDFRYANIEIIVYAEGKAMDVEAGDYLTEEEYEEFINTPTDATLCEQYCISIGASGSEGSCRCYFEGIGWRDAETGWRNL